MSQNTLALHLSRILRQIDKPLNKIVYIGAGSGGMLTDLNRLGPKRIVAVEASNELFPSLQRKSKMLDSVETIQSWILPVGKKSVTSYQYNNPRHNSLVLKKDLGKRYRNLKLLSQASVTGFSIDSFLKSLNLEQSDLNILVFGVGGDTSLLLKGLKPELLNTFSILVVANDVAYESECVDSSRIMPSGFDELPNLSEDQDGLQYFRLNETSIRLKENLQKLDAKYSELNKSNSATREDNATLTAQVKELTRHLESTSEEKKSLFTKLAEESSKRKKVQENLKSLTNKLALRDQNISSKDDCIQQLEIELKTSSDNFKDAIERLEKCRKELKSKDELIFDLEKSVENYSLCVDEREQEINSLASQCEERGIELQTLKNKCKGLEQDVAQANSELTSEMELREKTQTELKDIAIALDECKGLCKHHVVEQERLLSDLNDSAKTIDSLEQEQRQSLIEIQKLEERNVVLQKQNEESEERLKASSSQREKIEKVLEVNSKLLLKSEVDSQVLRQELLRKNQEIEGLTSLVQKLYVKLSQASKTYEELRGAYPELDWEKM